MMCGRAACIVLHKNQLCERWVWSKGETLQSLQCLAWYEIGHQAMQERCKPEAHDIQGAEHCTHLWRSLSRHESRLIADSAAAHD